MNNNVLRKANLDEANYKDLKQEIANKIYESYEYCHQKDIYRWSISHILNYLFLITDFKVNEGLYQSIENYLALQYGKRIGAAAIFIKTILKACIFYLHFAGLINLDYADIEFITTKSTVLRDFYERILNVTISKEEYKDIRRDILLIIMMKNRITQVELLKNEIIEEYKEYLCSELSQKASHKRAIFRIENKLFLKGILENNAKFLTATQRSKTEYYSSVKNKPVKDAIIWYIENTRSSKQSIKKFHPHLLHFAKFIDKNFNHIPISYYNCFISEIYNGYLEMGVATREIPSKNWASNCVTRINTFMNFLIDSQYIEHPQNRNIFLPNIFEERDKLITNRRESIPEHIVSKIKENMTLLDKEEQSILSVYLDTGVRLNELSLISIDDIHGDAKELISSTEYEIEDGIGWIKIVAPKILYTERIVLISWDTYKLLMFLVEERKKKYGNIAPQYNHRYPELGKRDFLLLNTYGAPYCNLDWKVADILKKLNIKNEDGSDFELTAHKFRHTFLTDLVRSGVPIYVAMDLMGHVSPAMTQYYDHFEKDNQDIISESKIISEQTQIKVKEMNNIVITGEQINKLHEINYKYLKRGGFCSIDEFQDDCSNIDCIECPSNKFKTNYSFYDELRKSMVSYLEQWSNELYEKSDKAIHLLYLSRLYRKMLEKVETKPHEIEVILTNEEKIDIANEVGME